MSQADAQMSPPAGPSTSSRPEHPAPKAPAAPSEASGMKVESSRASPATSVTESAGTSASQAPLFSARASDAGSTVPQVTPAKRAAGPSTAPALISGATNAPPVKKINTSATLSSPRPASGAANSRPIPSPAAGNPVTRPSAPIRPPPRPPVRMVSGDTPSSTSSATNTSTKQPAPASATTARPASAGAHAGRPQVPRPPHPQARPQARPPTSTNPTRLQAPSGSAARPVGPRPSTISSFAPSGAAASRPHVPSPSTPQSSNAQRTSSVRPHNSSAPKRAPVKSLAGSPHGDTQAGPSSFAANVTSTSASTSASPGPGPGPGPKDTRKRKVGTACIYCRRSHMTCDESRPCKRCIKRDIGHLCHDEATQSSVSAANPRRGSSSATVTASGAAGDSSTHGTAKVTPPAGTSKITKQRKGEGAQHAKVGAPPEGGPMTARSPAGMGPAPHLEIGEATDDSSGAPPGDLSIVAPPVGEGMSRPDSGEQVSLANPPNGLITPNAASAYSNLGQLPSAGWSWGGTGASALGGAGFLGLGGGAADEHGFSATGDAAGGLEFSILSEFLESLDGPTGLSSPSNGGAWGQAASSSQAQATPRLFSNALGESASRDGVVPSSDWGASGGMGSTPISSAGIMLDATLSSMAPSSPSTMGMMPRHSNQNNNDVFGTPGARHRTRGLSTSSMNGPGGMGSRLAFTTAPTPASVAAAANAATGPEGEASGSSMSPLLPSTTPRSGENASLSVVTGAPTAAGAGNGAYAPVLKGFSSKTEKFFLTAADQNDATREERLGKVIQAKYDAGLLRPYNHVNGYARLNRWMESHCSPASRRRILKPLSVFRPAFRAVAQQLTNIDLIYIEEAFERLLLDYDRVFSTQGIPACLWRRTGEIYKGNREFAELLGVGIEQLREGRLCIYELMDEESAVNYWEKYGAVSFDPGQKAVLTSCVLKIRTASFASGGWAAAGRPSSNSSVNASAVAAHLLPQGSGLNSASNSAPGSISNGGAEMNGSGNASRRGSMAQSSASALRGAQTMSRSNTATQEDEPGIVRVKCCFSFTIGRDAWNIPTLVAGNFIPVQK
ncbi:related to rds2-regulator of drug sensitivity [Ceraceosorus bombacis]|uniref:Related to rds2-regulator of drug sensitivity n=1 Tax=Ceraceosorus bombacis TaxID=401625 RepID=A0A0P1BNX7_9BASI|nr:related to rds2-regulator of drug sensitivity [Ceraceosorus bombacis]